MVFTRNNIIRRYPRDKKQNKKMMSKLYYKYYHGNKSNRRTGHKNVIKPMPLSVIQERVRLNSRHMTLLQEMHHVEVTISHRNGSGFNLKI